MNDDKVEPSLKTMPKWDDFRFKENAEIEYIKAFEKWFKDFEAKLREKLKEGHGVTCPVSGCGAFIEGYIEIEEILG